MAYVSDSALVGNYHRFQLWQVTADAEALQDAHYVFYGGHPIIMQCLTAVSACRL